MFAKKAQSAEILPPPPALASRLSPEFLQAQQLYPLADDGLTLTFAMALEADEGEKRKALANLAQSLNRQLAFTSMPAEKLARALQSHLQAGNINKNNTDFENTHTAKDLETLLASAEAEGASDIHLRPAPPHLLIYLRKQGALTLWQKKPVAEAAALISLIKHRAHLDVAEHRLPQDGSLSFTTQNGSLSAARVSILPMQMAQQNDAALNPRPQSVALRLPQRHIAPAKLAELGFNSAQGAQMQNWAQAEHGLILATGPTGSGKTTTLYALLREILQQGRHGVSLEDPVEQTIAGLVQVPIQAAIGLDFPSGLRALLRHDPDVILVGEIRDAETAQIAIEAALTGHLVLSSLHTGTAAGALTRLLAMGVAPWALAEALRGIINQRLIVQANTRRAIGTLLSPSAALRTMIASKTLPPHMAAAEEAELQTALEAAGNNASS